MPLELVHGDVLEPRPTRTANIRLRSALLGSPAHSLADLHGRMSLCSSAPVASDYAFSKERTPREKDVEQTTRLWK